ncbi:MAG: IS200/IS605 family transposase, partial [Phycisphaerales bacterium]|nr:IS200/IS605 family transposase [Phycisphaerales bacterium]
MPGTWSKILLHFVFSTKDRVPELAPEIAERLYPYMGGIIDAHKSQLLCAGGMPDHVHLLVRSSHDRSAADLMRETKASSSKWLRQTFPELRSFAWQDGYGVFSVSESAADSVRTYICHQAEHHRER